MKTPIKNLFLLPVLIAGFSLMPAGRVVAQTFTNLYSFTAAGYDSLNDTDTNNDGAYPSAGLILSVSGNTLYGTTPDGGTNGKGTVFAVNTDGTGFTVLHTFTALVNSTNSDGANPVAGLLQSGNQLYGTTPDGGTYGNGTVFALNIQTLDFTNLHNFTAYSHGTNSDGANPQAGLVLSDFVTLYGTAYGGGAGGNGTVFSINNDGTDFTNLYNFTAYSHGTNSDGANPQGTLISSGSTLYGTASGGGAGGNGTVFAININSTGFTNLYSFTALSSEYFNNLDGANPFAGLVLSGSTLFGTAGNGGNSFDGTLFAMTTNGESFSTVHTFTNTPDGASPHGGVILSGNTLYGTAESGGTNDSGMVFSVSLPISGMAACREHPHHKLATSAAMKTSADEAKAIPHKAKNKDFLMQSLSVFFDKCSKNLANPQSSQNQEQPPRAQKSQSPVTN